MNSPKENPLQPASIVEGSQEDKDINLTLLTERVKRNGTRKNHTLQVIDQIALLPLAVDLVPITRIRQCSDYLAFNNYYQKREIKLASANFCKVHQICSQCAQRRGTRYGQEILKSIQETKPEFLQLITLTVKNSHDLQNALERLFAYFKILNNRYKRQNTKDSITSLFIGGVWSIEITYSNEYGWHPHIHGLIASKKRIYTHEVRAEWESISNGDSYICDSSPVDTSTDETLFKSVAEVCKYTLKNSSLPAAELMEVYVALKRKQLIRRFGTFSGRDVSMVDIADYSNEPFYQYLFKFFNNKYNFNHDGFAHYENAQDYETNKKWKINYEQ